MWTISMRGAREALAIATGMLGLSVLMVVVVMTIVNTLDAIIN